MRQKKRNKKVQNINNKKSRKIRERKKMRQNENKVKKNIKEIFQGYYEKKRYIESFKPREKVLKLKMKIKTIQ